MTSLGDWIYTVLYAVLTTLLGMGLIASVPDASTSGHDPQGRWPLAYLLGQLVWLTLILLTGFLPISINAMIWFAVALAGLSALRLIQKQGVHAPARELGNACLWLVIVAVAFPSLIVALRYLPLRDWDARSIWFFHAKSLVLDGRLAASCFTNAAYAWSHLDYPLLLPAQAAVFTIVRGHWTDYGSKAFLLVNLAAYLRLTYGILRSKGLHPVFALLLTTWFFDKWPNGFVNGYADDHYIICLILTFLLMLKPGGSLLTASVLLAYAANMKHEGALYVVLFLCIGGITPALSQVWQPKENSRSLLCVIVAGLLPWALWAVFCATHGITGDLHLLRTLSHPRHVVDLLHERLPIVLRYMTDYYQVNGSIPIIAAVLILYGIRLFMDKTSGQKTGTEGDVRLWLMFGMVNAAILVVFILTPYPVEWHMTTAGSRLLLLPDLILRVIAVGTLLPLLERLIGHHHYRKV